MIDLERAEIDGIFRPGDTPSQRRALERELIARMESGEEDPMLDPFGGQVIYPPIEEDDLGSLTREEIDADLLDGIEAAQTKIDHQP